MHYNINDNDSGPVGLVLVLLLFIVGLPAGLGLLTLLVMRWRQPGYYAQVGPVLLGACAGSWAGHLFGPAAGPSYLMVLNLLAPPVLGALVVYYRTRRSR